MTGWPPECRELVPGGGEGVLPEILKPGERATVLLRAEAGYFVSRKRGAPLVQLGWLPDR
ncbi:hypothetical protein ADL29_20170 [Streptomyces chattanoogensis]|uniref:Uncharacterized protein n=1 Tax=Streptomyces chattanoogensis TaxID=66876 RepID=A0A0N0XW27_9ACTN|nr:hypothetical protein ADL29_20170 [Streptomyces chattanoogensis]